MSQPLTSELVERLNGLAVDCENTDGFEDAASDVRQAADEILRLQAEVERLRNIMDERGLHDPDLAKMAGNRTTAIEASISGPRKFDPTARAALGDDV